MALESSDTILYLAKISYQSVSCFGNCTHTKTQKDTHTQTHTDTHTHRHIHRGPFYVLFFCENAETRLKIALRVKLC